MTPRETHAESNKLISKLIEIGLSSDQNFPAMIASPGNVVDISLEGTHDFSVAMKCNLSYRTIFETLERNRTYHVKMIDGGLLQLLFRFRSEHLVSHRLSYFPSPDFEAFQNDPEVYMSDPIFGDVLNKSVVPFPIRFDYNESDKIHVDIYHPKCHLSLGQYENCRIPASSPLTPYSFVSFIVDSFYRRAPELIHNLSSRVIQKPPMCITKNETGVTHISIA